MHLGPYRTSNLTPPPSFWQRALKRILKLGKSMRNSAKAILELTIIVVLTLVVMAIPIGISHYLNHDCISACRSEGLHFTETYSDYECICSEQTQYSTLHKESTKS